MHLRHEYATKWVARPDTICTHRLGLSENDPLYSDPLGDNSGRQQHGGIVSGDSIPSKAASITGQSGAGGLLPKPIYIARDRPTRRA